MHALSRSLPHHEKGLGQTYCYYTLQATISKHPQTAQVNTGHTVLSNESK